MNAAGAASTGAPPALRMGAWLDIPGLEHGFFGRAGGVSTGDRAALNVSERVGDEPAAVAANWAAIGGVFAHLSCIRMRQVHGVRVQRVDAVDQAVGEADGLIARSDGVGLAILTADCVPILCVAPAARAVMALHAGWRGTVSGIVAAGLAEAQRSFGVEPGAWQVAMGPSIGGCCYEVEAHIGQQLVDRWGAMPDAWQPAGRRGQLDLRGANRRILLAHGVAGSQITAIGPCTSCESGKYFSHRRSGGRAGRQVSVVGWAG